MADGADCCSADTEDLARFLASDLALLARIEDSSMWAEISRPPVGDEALSVLVSWMDDNDIDGLSDAELRELASGARPGAPDHVEASARYLVDPAGR